MKLKKLLAISMSAVLAMTALTACGSKDNGSKDNGSKSDSGNTTFTVSIPKNQIEVIKS